MQGNNQGYPPKKIGSGTKGFLWGGGIIAIIGGIVVLLPGLVYVAFFVMATGVNGVVGEENMPYFSQNRQGVTESVAKFTPKASWTELSKSEVHKPAACTDADRGTPKKDCEMFKGVWNTNAPYNENSIFDIAKSFGKTDAVNNKSNKEIKDSCVRASPESPLVPCRVQTYISFADNNSYIFTVTLTDQGPGTDVIATVTYVR